MFFRISFCFILAMKLAALPYLFHHSKSILCICKFNVYFCGKPEGILLAFFLGHRTKDRMCAPLRLNEEGTANLEYLLRDTEIFQKWRNSNKSGLTTQTFSACIQTMSAVPELLQQLQNRFIFPGKFTSDSIEGWFGCYRQVNGENYFMSVNQILQAEKKIRVLSLLQQHILLSGSYLMKLDDLPLKKVDMNNAGGEDLQWLVDFFTETLAKELEKLSSTDVNVTYFVSGYIGRSLLSREKCSFCKSLLVAGLDPPSLRDCVPQDFKCLLENANHGGFAEPSELCFATTMSAVQCYTALVADKSRRAKLFSLQNQKSAFISALVKCAAFC